MLLVLSVVNQAHSLTHDRLRHFGLMKIQNGVMNWDSVGAGLKKLVREDPRGIVARANTLEATSDARNFGETEVQSPRLYSPSPTSAKLTDNGCVA